MRTIQYDESLPTVWEELVYSEARLVKDKHAKALAAKISALLKKWPRVNAAQLACWRDEVVAQAGVDAENDDLDDTVDEIDHTLYNIVRDATSPRYRRYFAKAPNEIIRMGLASEIEVVRDWPGSLATEPEAPLKKLGKQLAGNVKSGTDALAARGQAATNTKDHRVRKIVAFIDEVNTTRRVVYAELIRIGEAKKRPKSWPDRFFRKSDSASAKDAGEAKPAKKARESAETKPAKEAKPAAPQAEPKQDTPIPS